MLIPVVTATAVGSPVFGRLIDSYGSRLIIICGLILTSLGFFLLQAVEASRGQFYAAGVFIGLGMSILSGSSLRYIMLNEVPAHDRAVSQGMVIIFLSLGQIVGAALIGVILVSGEEDAQGLRNVFLGLSLLLAAVVSVAWMLKTREEELADARQ